MPDWDVIFKSEGKVFLDPVPEVINFIKLLKKKGVQRILDMGCGSGRHTVLLAKNGFEVYGMDNSPTALEQTQDWLFQENVNAKLILSDCYKKFPFEDSFFDAIISTQVIHHALIEDIDFCISEIKRTLRKDGAILITVAKEKISDIRGNNVKEIAPNTYVPLNGREKGTTHFIFDEGLLREHFKCFKIESIYVDSINHWCLLGYNLL